MGLKIVTPLVIVLVVSITSLVILFTIFAVNAQTRDQPALPPKLTVGSDIAHSAHCDQPGWPSCYDVGLAKGKASPGTQCPPGHSASFCNGWDAGANVAETNIHCRFGCKLTVRIGGDGFGVVKDFENDIKCATGNVEKCTLTVQSSPSSRRLEYLAAPFSQFERSDGDCPDITQAILIDRNKTCFVTFRDTTPNSIFSSSPFFPSRGTAMPSNVIHSISPEAVEAISDIYQRYSVFVGWPTSTDTRIPGGIDYQPLETSEALANYWGQNSIETHFSTDGSFCAYAAFLPEHTPNWYDTFDAVDDKDNRFKYTAHREWAGGDNRNLGDIVASNWSPASWPNSALPFDQKGPIPPGRGPTPQWIKSCFPAHEHLQIPKVHLPSHPLQDPGKYCNYKQFNVWSFGDLNVAQWCPIDPPINYNNRNPSIQLPWVPHTATGVVTQGLTAGDDFGESHGDMSAIAPNYWLGIKPPEIPGKPDPFWNSPHSCDTELFHANHDKCNDWQNGIYPDPESTYLVAPLLAYHDNVWTEIEQWLIPQGYRPDPGDREIAVGRWIADGGEDFHTELHPTEAEVSTFLQTAPLHRYETPNLLVTSVAPPGGYHSVPPPTTPGLTMLNFPLISDRWSELTHGDAATVTKFVITSDWQGEELTFEIYPPPRPSPNAILHWAKEPGITQMSHDLLYSLEPANNPNHLVITVPHANLPQLHVNPHYGQVFPDPNRRIVNAYMLWWEEPHIALPP